MPSWPLVAERGAWLWPYGGLAALLILAVWPAWFTQNVLVIGGDALLIHYPWFVLWRDTLAAGEFPWWNPYTFSGLPAFATLQAGYGYPPHWAFSGVPAIPAMNWMVGLHVLLAGLATAWCAGRLGASKEGQFLSGATYALGSAITARLWAGHLSFLEANAWLPLATGLAIQIRQRRGVAYLALAVALLTLAGQPEVLIFSLWWLPIWAGLGAHREGVRGVIRALARAGFGIGLGVGLATFQLLPVVELLPSSNRSVGMSWEFLTGASLPPWHLLGVLGPLVFGDPQQTYWPGPSYEWHERLLYVGAVPLLATGRATGRWRWICWGLAALAVALAFGSYAPWYAWTEVVPGYRSFRIPSKHLTLAALALALAAGIGVQRLHGHRVSLVAMLMSALLAVAGLTFAAWFPAMATLLGGSEELAMLTVRDSIAADAVRPLLATSLVFALLSMAALLPTLWARRIAVLLAILELLLVLGPYRFQPADPQYILDEAEALRGYARAAVVGDNGAILGNYGPVVRVTQPAGYVSLFSRGYMSLLTGSANEGVAISIEQGDDPILYLLGYGVVVEPEEQRVKTAELAPPQVWVARCAWPGSELDVREPSFPRQECIARSSATVREQPVPPGPAKLVGQRPGWLLIEADGPGWLVTTQPWYPGWSAWIDDVPASAEVVNGALVGLPLSAGPQTVTLRYRPAGLELGLLSSGATGLALLASWRWPAGSARRPGTRASVPRRR